MTVARRYTASLLLIPVIVVCAQLALGKKKEKPTASSQMDDHQRAVQALNRLTFGPRPGDVEQVMTTGVDRWIDQQLHPDRIDDGALEARLESLRTLRMSTKEMVDNFPPEPVIQAIANGKRSLPSDPLKRAVYEAQLDGYQERQEQKTANNGSAAETTGKATENQNSDASHAAHGQMPEGAENCWTFCLRRSA